MSRRMSFQDAMDLLSDDMPDGAFWAMAHDMAGLDYGEGFDQIAEALDPPKPFSCHYCAKRFASERALGDHQKGKHAKRLAREAALAARDQTP